MRSSFNWTSAAATLLIKNCWNTSVTSQGGNNEANVLAKFYSHAQKPREMEEASANELQLLAHKVISKKPDFHQNLNTTFKQHYVNQLYDCNNASIAKTLLLPMPKVTFTQFCNELARILGTCQHPKASSKAVCFYGRVRVREGSCTIQGPAEMQGQGKCTEFPDLGSV